MLVLSRKISEIIRIGHDIKIMVVQIGSETVRIGIEAPLNLTVHREEVYQDIQRRGPRDGGTDGY